MTPNAPTSETQQIGSFWSERHLDGSASTSWHQVTLLPAVEADRRQCLPVEGGGPARIEVLMYLQVRGRSRGDRDTPRLLLPVDNPRVSNSWLVNGVGVPTSFRVNDGDIERHPAAWRNELMRAAHLSVR